MNLQDWLTLSMGSEMALPEDVSILPDDVTPASASDQDYIDAYTTSFMSRPVVMEKSKGVATPDSEAASLFESVALNLLTHPRVVLYAAHLARNALVKSINDEITAIDEVGKLVRDFTNMSFRVKDTAALDQARIALLQIEGQGRLDGSSVAATRFSDSVSEFLEELAKSVRGSSTELLRPSSEAEALLPSSYARLVSLHKDSSDRLLSIATGIDSFFSSSIGSLLCLSTVQTVRGDIESLLEDISADSTGAKSREAVYRLISARALLKIIGSPPAWDAPISVSGSSLGGALITLDNPTTDLQPGDFISDIEVLLVDGDTVELASAVAPFEGTVEAESGLVRMWTVLRRELGDAVTAWEASGFSEGLSSLDGALAGLTSSSPNTKSAEALRVLNSLKTSLQEMLSHLQEARPRSVKNEKRILDGILNTLSERGYDRAAATLLRGGVSDIFYMDWQTASYAGNLMKAVSSVAQNDIKFPNKDRDERGMFSHREAD